MRKTCLLLLASTLLLPGCVLAVGGRSHDSDELRLRKLEKRVTALEQCCEQTCETLATECADDCAKACCREP